MEGKTVTPNKHEFLFPGRYSTPHSSLVDTTTDINSVKKNRDKRISFLSPKDSGTQSFISGSSNNQSFFSPHVRSFSSPKDSLSKDFSLKKIETLSKIHENYSEVNTDRDTGKGTMRETARERDLDTFIENKSLRLFSEHPTIARRLSEESDFDDIPTLKWCAFCKKETCTEIIYKNSKTTFFTSAGIFLMGGFFGCFLLPYMTNICKDHCLVCHTCKRQINDSLKIS